MADMVDIDTKSSIELGSVDANIPSEAQLDGDQSTVEMQTNRQKVKPETPSDADQSKFVPDASHIRSTDPLSLEYWEKVLAKCVPETQLNAPAPGRRDTFALGNVIIKSDHQSAEPTGDYSFWDENEEAAVNLVAGVLPDVKLPEYYLRTKLRGRDILVRSRIPGVSLEVAWPSLNTDQKASFKEETRDIVRRIHRIKPNELRASYVVDSSSPDESTGLRQDERNILFGDSTAEDGNYGLSHNDLLPSNIIVENGKIVGIVGWSNAGYFGYEKSGNVHRRIRCKDDNGNMIQELWEESSPWHDLYDIARDEEKTFSDTAEVESKNDRPSVKSEELLPNLSAVPYTATSENFDFRTPKKIIDLKQESVSRASSSERSSPAPSVKSTKKRAAPAATKKGQAVRKSATKKRKLNDAESIDGTVGSQRSSATPASRSKPSKQRNRKQTSASIASSPAPDGKRRGKSNDSDEDMEEDEADASELFCICRKPDNHTWMIACDGGCEDWFHGKCVNIKQIDADLIDKYICPNCEEKQGIRTTWKRMCRLPGCRQPARVTAKTPSKYCSDDHGVEFMKRKLRIAESRSTSSHIPSAASRGSLCQTNSRQTHQENGYVESGSLNSNGDQVTNEIVRDADDAGAEREGTEDLMNIGGVLTPREVKAMADGVKSAEEFRKLGESLLSTETQGLQSLREVAESFDPKSEMPGKSIDFDLLADNIEWTPEERKHMDSLKEKRADLLNRSQLLRDRDRFLTLVRQRAKNILERLRQNDPKGWKDICGFDSRLSWSDEEFDEWRQSEVGKKALGDGVLEPERSVDNAGDTEMADADKNEVDTIAQGMCIKKRCEQHRQWAKVQQQDILFELSIVKDHLSKCGKTATEVIEGVVLRAYGDQNRTVGGAT
ncbi:hypothetical protein D8B26_003229 [Coccidioides posadasii str. Silveira]|uniref:Uncharacterized protein n=1 Tax=Coccidioides posadasii (strain RMSCC 757 / Silveira) TaxID=443226 RepID=E9D0C8_COCPS|nr:conserved hypothetical protein [Coccidioides posadasii str. Silveira]QVM08541.1 hypothetical protein D8B26_003229 [Coccidioides posadasii str. Silveira]